MKKQIGILVIWFLAGIASAQLFGTHFLTTYGFLNKYHMNAFASAEMDFLQVFWNTLWERGKEFLVLIILGITPIRKHLPMILKSILTYAFGLFLCACVMNMGIGGIAVAVCSLFPQIIPYVLAILLIFHMEEKPQKVIHKKANVISPILSYVMWGALVITLILIACLLESTIGVYILQKIVKIIC